MSDSIEVRGLQLDVHIGVPAEERAEPQRVLADVRMWPRRDFSAMPDEIGATVDYFRVSQRLVAVAAERPRQLIETLADELAGTVLREFAVVRVEITIRKFILPNAEHVAVHCCRRV